MNQIIQILFLEYLEKQINLNLKIYNLIFDFYFPQKTDLKSFVEKYHYIYKNII